MTTTLFSQPLKCYAFSEMVAGRNDVRAYTSEHLAWLAFEPRILIQASQPLIYSTIAQKLNSFARLSCRHSVSLMQTKQLMAP